MLEKIVRDKFKILSVFGVSQGLALKKNFKYWLLFYKWYKH